MSTVPLLDDLWTDYVASTPQAESIRDLLATRGELIHHDNLALWTYAMPGIDTEALRGTFEELGWRARERHPIDVRHVCSRAWQHPDPELPKVVIAELAVAQLSSRAQEIIAELVAQLPARFARCGLTGIGRPWQLAHADYMVLLAESPHAAWVAAFGPRAHHFTIDVGALATFPDLVALDAFLIEHGFPVDCREPAGEEHATTRADAIEVEFLDATVRIPAGTYELVLPARTVRERGEIVVELEQHVDIDTHELHTHSTRGGPAHHRG